ncbi:MAG TPA: hypothetical protein VNK04_27090 [Gemmataceae bacterium]|nr:hypothetical protein [Gemmataceae bacterium]
MLLLWVVLLDFPTFTAGPALDHSWQQALGYFLKNRLQAGTDYIFTYGPLGYFYTRAYDPDLFGPKYAWELIIKMAIALAVVRVGSRIPQPTARAVFFLAVLFLPDHPDALYPFFILLLAVIPFDRVAGAESAKLWPPPSSWAVPCAGLLGVLGLVKFNLFLFALAAMLALALTLAAERRRRAALAAVASFLVCLMAAWILTGQSLVNLPRYLHGSMQIAEGYVEAMAAEGSSGEVYHALAVMALFLAALAAWGLRALVRPQRVLLLGLLGLSLFLQWKHAFVRHGCHTMIFFSFAALVPLVGSAIFRADRPSRRRTLLAAAGVTLALFGGFAYDPSAVRFLGPVRQRFERTVANAQMLLFPAPAREKLEAQRRALEKAWSLPRVRAEVGAATVDVFSHQQGVVLLNGLRYRPRPVFQSYSAYTPYLLAANARFYQSDSAPDYVLIQLKPIDDRVPASEDSPALREVFRRYRPVLVEKSFLLLQRATEAAAPSLGAVIGETTARFGEEVRLDHLSGSRQSIQVQVRYAAWGRMRRLLLRPSPLFLRVAIDGEGVRHYRLIPALAEEGFLLNPFIEDTQGLLRLLEQGGGKRVRSLCVTDAMTGSPGAAPACYEDEVRVVIRAGW